MVATVQGIEVTRGDIRRDAEFWIVTNRASTREDATHKSIVHVIDRFITQAAIERRQLTATHQEAEEYMSRQRTFCLGEHGEECREAVARFGFDPNSEEY